MKKTKNLIISILIPLLILSGCATTVTPNNVHREPHFAGVVVEVHDGAILVRANDGEDVRMSSDLFYVSTDTELYSPAEFNVGDEVVVFYDGYIMESYPAQISRVYMISQNRIGVDANADIVDLGCCVKNIAVRETPVIGANSVTHVSNDFIMTLNSDKKVYKTTDIINIWGTLEYIGDNDTIEIWHGCPFMLFSVSDGNKYDLGGMTIDILTTSVLQKNRVYHFEYQKSGGYSADAPDAEYWRNFFSEPDLLLPVGEYTVTLHGGFSLSERVIDSRSGLLCELKITVEP